MLGRVLSVLVIGLGIAVVVQTAVHGGEGLAYGYIFGPLLVLAGGLRLYVLQKVRN